MQYDRTNNIAEAQQKVLKASLKKGLNIDLAAAELYQLAQFVELEVPRLQKDMLQPKPRRVNEVKLVIQYSKANKRGQANENKKSSKKASKKNNIPQQKG